MKSFTYTCLCISEVCKHNSLDIGEIMDEICASDVSFGTNADTLISVNQLEDIISLKLDWDNHDEDTILISLGS